MHFDPLFKLVPPHNLKPRKVGFGDEKALFKG